MAVQVHDQPFRSALKPHEQIGEGRFVEGGEVFAAATVFHHQLTFHLNASGAGELGLGVGVHETQGKDPS
jgi:hypothetical protein